MYTRFDYMPLYFSSRCGGMSFVGAGWVQVGGDEKNSFMSRGIITDFFFFQRGRKVAGSGMTPDLAHGALVVCPDGDGDGDDGRRVCGREPRHIESRISRRRKLFLLARGERVGRGAVRYAFLFEACTRISCC